MGTNKNNSDMTTLNESTDHRSLAVAFVSGMVLTLIISLIYLLYQLHYHNDNLESAVKNLAPQNLYVLIAVIVGSIAMLVLNFTSRLNSDVQNETALHHFWYSFKLNFGICVISLSCFSLAVRHIF